MSKANKSKHVFKLTVKGPHSRHLAWLYVLRCFAMRQPDGCEFILSKMRLKAMPIYTKAAK